VPRRVAHPLLAAVACLTGLVVTGVLAYLVPLARVRDTATLQGFVALHRTRIEPLFSAIVHWADPVPYALIGLALAAIALGRRRPRVAAAIPLVLVVTGATTQILKPLLAHPRFEDWLGSGQIAAASWPSGHATAAMTLALCAVVAVPARMRPAAALAGGAFATVVAYAILVLAWHFPSDVLGGFFVAGFWMAVAVAGLAWLERRRPSAARVEAPARPLDPRVVAGAVGGAAVALAVIAATHPVAVTDYVLQRPTFAAGAAVIAGLATVLAAGLARVTTRL
jgi:membrane-associated phospholipid phosphatase